MPLALARRISEANAAGAGFRINVWTGASTADRPPRRRHGSGLGKQRWVVERGFAWLHAFQRLRSRYERRADLHLELLQLACALICYRHLKPILKWALTAVLTAIAPHHGDAAACP